MTTCRLAIVNIVVTAPDAPTARLYWAELEAPVRTVERAAHGTTLSSGDATTVTFRKRGYRFAITNLDAAKTLWARFDIAEDALATGDDDAIAVPPLTTVERVSRAGKSSLEVVSNGAVEFHVEQVR